MTVEGQPAGTEVLPHRKTYDNYVRIVEPGRHLFRCRISVGRVLLTMFGVGGSAFLAWMGVRIRTVFHGGAVDIVFMCFTWMCGLVMAITSAWGILHDTVLEIAPRQITLKRRRFLRWTKICSCDLSSFLEAKVLPFPIFSVGGGTVEYVPELLFYFDFFRMSETLYLKKDAEEFVHDINASVERARQAPEAFYP